MSDTTNIRSFKGDLQRMIDKLGISKKLVMQKVSLDLWKKVTEGNPVDTGRSRANWNLTEGEPSTEVNEHEGAKTGSVPEPSIPSVSEISGEQPVYLINNLPYVSVLEDGSSAQAPSGFVRLAMQAEAAELDRITGEVQQDS